MLYRTLRRAVASTTCALSALIPVGHAHRPLPIKQPIKHDPFMYFHSVIDSASCQKNVVPLTRLEADLRSAGRTPNFAFIAPSLCHDGHDRPRRNGEPGGGRTGAVLLSRSIRPGTVSDVPYNHYSMLRSIEDIFGLKHLGYAGQRGLATFGADVYTSGRVSK